MTSTISSADDQPVKPKGKRAAPLNQADVPAYSLSEAMRVPEAIRDQFAKQPTTPLDLAVALDMSPNSSTYRMLTGAALAYGLTDGGAFANSIGLTDLGKRVVSPIEEGDDLLAMREAALKPRVIREFLEKYNGSPLPIKQIALNVIESMNVPPSAGARAYDMIIANADSLALLVELKGKKYVRLEGARNPVGRPTESSRVDDLSVQSDHNPTGTSDNDQGTYQLTEAPALPEQSPTDPVTNNRVFITHGKNHKVVDQIKKILTFGKFEAVVSVDQQSVAKPVPEKVLDDMRSCSAAIVHVGAERKLLDDQGVEHTQINPNVLIEIGAAMALYARRFVLLVERGVALPSNLQGLYEVRYEGEQLDHDATMKLLEAFNDFR